MFHPNLTERLGNSPCSGGTTEHRGVKWAYPLASVGASQLPVCIRESVRSMSKASCVAIRKSGAPEQAAFIVNACPMARFWRIIREWTGLAVTAGVGLAVIGVALFVAALAVGALAGALAALAQALMAVATGAVLLAFALLMLMAIARARRSR